MSKLDKTENLLFLPAQTAKAHTKAHTKVFAFVHFQDKNYVHTNVLAMLAPPAKDVKKKKKGQLSQTANQHKDFCHTPCHEENNAKCLPTKRTGHTASSQCVQNSCRSCAR